jgi:hypothetical protein
MEVRSSLAYSAGTAYGAFDIGTLIKFLPKLHEIGMYLEIQSPPLQSDTLVDFFSLNFWRFELHKR